MRKASFFAIVLLVLFFLSSCGQESTPVQPAPTQTQPQATTTSTATQAVPTSTPLPTATKTRQPTRTSTSKPTPLPTPVLQQPADGLKTNGPYLVYHRNKITASAWERDETSIPTRLTVMDADGSGQITFDLPNLGYIANLNRAFSPDGEWITYYTGSPWDVSEDGGYEFALHLYQWRTGRDIKVTDLLSRDYPDNFEKTANMLGTSDPQTYAGWGKDLIDGMRITFIAGIYQSTWSPDGRYLAFAGEQDGPSSDLYLYVLSTGEIRRLTDGPAHIEWMMWTPDSQKIFHYSAYTGCAGECGWYHVAQIDGKAWTLKDVDSYGGGNIFAGWVSNNQMALYSHANGPYGPLRYLNIDTGEDVIIFDGGVQTAEYDPEDRRWLVSAVDDKPGLYLVNPSTKSRQRISGDICSQLFFVGYQDQRFYANCGGYFSDGSLSIVQRDGTIAYPVDGPLSLLKIAQQSPDKQWYVTADDFQIRLYDIPGKLQYTVDRYGVAAFMWRPDSKGFYFLAPAQVGFKNSLYSFSLADYSFVRVDESIEKDFDPCCEYWEFLWIN